MRWLFLKDLQILRRSPLVTALLVLYPVAIAVLIGFALSRSPEKPRVAFLNEVPQDTPFVLGGSKFDLTGARSELCSRIDCVDVSSEAEARQMVESGDALAALILPPDLITKLESLGSLNPAQPTVRVLVNEEDPVKAGLVNDQISSLVTQANLRISKEVSHISASLPGPAPAGRELSSARPVADHPRTRRTHRAFSSRFAPASRNAARRPPSSSG